MTLRSRAAILVPLAWAIVAASHASAQNTRAPFVVLEAQVPKYVPIARTAGLAGTVTLDVHVEQGVVTTVTPRSGPPLLFDETVRNIKTWTFDSSNSGDVTTVFEYRLRGAATSESENPEIELRLPYNVTITTRPYQAQGVF